MYRIQLIQFLIGMPKTRQLTDRAVQYYHKYKLVQHYSKYNIILSSICKYELRALRVKICLSVLNEYFTNAMLSLRKINFLTENCPLYSQEQRVTLGMRSAASVTGGGWNQEQSLPNGHPPTEIDSASVTQRSVQLALKKSLKSRQQLSSSWTSSRERAVTCHFVSR